jgi:hypothetical protein
MPLLPSRSTGREEGSEGRRDGKVCDTDGTLMKSGYRKKLVDD